MSAFANPRRPRSKVGRERLSVLVVTPKGMLGGAERWLLSVLDHADRISATVVVLQKGPLSSALRDRGIATTVLPTGRKASDVARVARHLLRVLNSEEPDVILANGIKAATAVLGPARLLGVPVVWVRHEDSFARTLGRLALWLSDRTIVVSPPPRRDLRYEPQFIPPPVLVEPVPETEAKAALRRLGVPDDGLLRVGLMSRLARYKGIDTMIASLAAEGGDAWRLVVAGIPDPGQPGDEQAYLNDLASNLDVADRVSWLGEVEYAGRWVRALDAVAVPTRAGVPGYPSAEGFPLAVIEALAGGVPVLADASTVPALEVPGYRDGVSWIDSTDSASVAAALRSLAEPAQRAQLATQAAAIGARHPRPAAVASAVTRVLARACHRPGAGLTTGPALSVVSTVRNEAGSIDKWLSSLKEQLEQGDEIIVVDGGSEDGTAERLRACSALDGRIRVFDAPGAGISEGRNVGIAGATNEWIACTDAGCVPDARWLEALRVAAAEDGVDLVTGVYRAGPTEGKAWELALAAVAYPVPEELRRATPMDRFYGRVFGRAYDATLPTGRSIAFKKGVWRMAGGYPEDLATAEDVVFGKRAVAAGAHAELALDAGVTWDQRPTLSGNARMFRGYGRGDGQSGDPQLVARNVVRAAAYLIGPALWLWAPKARPALTAAAAMYLSVPLRRALGGSRPIVTAALVPAMAAMRDVSKAIGCVESLLKGQRSTP